MSLRRDEERIIREMWLARLAAGHHGSLAVRSGSMAPLIRPGDILIVGPRPERLRTGDLAIFERDGQLICHRLMWPRGGGLWIEKGDLNEDRSVIRDGEVVGTPHEIVAGGIHHPLHGAGFRRWNRLAWLLVAWRDGIRSLARAVGRPGGLGESLLSRSIAAIMARIRPEGETP